MWRRYLVSLLLLCAALFLLGSFPGSAAAQDRESVYPSIVGQPAGLDDIAALFRRAPIPVQLYRLEGPDSLAVGEEGRFAAAANIEAASLPLRPRWDFGDGTTAKGLHALHRYAEPGTYMVTFTLANDHSEAADTLTVTVLPAGDALAASAPHAPPNPIRSFLPDSRQPNAPKG